MTETVVVLDFIDIDEIDHLMNALDDFVRMWEGGEKRNGAETPPDFMLKTEHTGSEVHRKLVFQEESHASQFMLFWKQDRFRKAG